MKQCVPLSHNKLAALEVILVHVNKQRRSFVVLKVCMKDETFEFEIKDEEGSHLKLAK